MMLAHRNLKTLARQCRGVSTLDFALVAPALLLLVLGGMDIGRAILDSQRLQDAVSSGAAYAVLHPKDSAGIQSAVARDLQNQKNVTVGPADIQCTCNDGSSISCSATASCTDGTETKIFYLTIRADHTFEPLTPLSSAFLGEVVLAGQVRVRLH
jgi:Flp pilus assembly protein TadG